MKLFVLADNRQEKGKQLESLVTRILQNYKCNNVEPNLRGAGGDEIDVTAYYTDKTNCTRKIICECKAHDNPIDMDDWDKFLGKFFKHDNGYTLGFMIALSGAKASVLGDIAANDKKYGNRIKLISGSALIEPLRTLYNIQDENYVRSIANNLADDLTIETNLILYKDDIYWLLCFSSGTFTIFDKNLNSINDNQAGKLITLLSEETSYVFAQYRDIRQEDDSKRKKQFVNIISIWKLMSCSCSIIELQNSLINLCPDCKGFEIPYIEECLTELPYINLKDDEVCLKEPKDIDYILFYKIAVSDNIPLNLFSNYYLEHIDISLLEKICTIQYGIKLTEQEIDDSLFLLKHSPSALRYSLHCDKLLRNANLPFDGLNEKFVNIFKDNLIRCFISDFENDNSCYMYNKLGIREVNLCTSLNVNTVTINGESKSITSSKSQCYFHTNNPNNGIRFIRMD